MTKVSYLPPPTLELRLNGGWAAYRNNCEHELWLWDQTQSAQGGSMSVGYLMSYLIHMNFDGSKWWFFVNWETAY